MYFLFYDFKKCLLLTQSLVSRQHDEYLKNYLASGEAKILGKPRTVIAERKDKRTFPIFLSVSELKVAKGKERVFIGTAKDMSSVKVQGHSGSETAGKTKAFLRRLVECVSLI